jgi:hypothetical protein
MEDIMRQSEPTVSPDEKIAWAQAVVDMVNAETFGRGNPRPLIANGDTFSEINRNVGEILGDSIKLEEAKRNHETNTRFISDLEDNHQANKPTDVYEKYQQAYDVTPEQAVRVLNDQRWKSKGLVINKSIETNPCDTMAVGGALAALRVSKKNYKLTGTDGPPTGYEVKGEGLTLLANAGVNFPGSSSYRSRVNA